MERQFNKPELKCRGGCGFYGNPNWQGYCSICRKKCMAASSPGDENVGNDDRLRTFSINATSTPPLSPSLSRTEAAPLSRESSVAASFIKAVGLGESPSIASTSGRASPLSQRPKPDRFTAILRTLPRSVSSEVDSFVKRFLHKLHNRTFASIDELSEFVQKFYQRLEEKLSKNAVYVALPSQVTGELWDEIEIHVCLRLYKTVFAHLQDEEADLALHNKLRSLLKEIKPADLELPLAFADSENSEDEEESNMKHLLDDAFLAIVDMTTKPTPQEILGCLSACCSALFSALRAALPNPPSADDFLPALIYCVIRTNPPQIHSTIAYVERFALPRRILDGEAAYYFTNLCCAVKFLDANNAAAIKAKKDPKKTDANEQAAKDEAAALGCSIAAVKADHRLKNVAQTQSDLSTRVDNFEDSVNTLKENIQEKATGLIDSINSACEEADKAIETQLFIDLSDPSLSHSCEPQDNSNSGADSGQREKDKEILKLYALGTMDAEAVEQVKASLTQPAKGDVKHQNEVSSAPPLIDFESDLPTPHQTSS